MSALGALYAIMALDEAQRASRVAHPRPRDTGLDPARAEARASAWSRWIQRRGVERIEGRPADRLPDGRRAAHV